MPMTQLPNDVVRPPASLMSWLTLLGLLLAVGSGAYGFGVLQNRVHVLESFAPISVDRRLTIIETQMTEVVTRLRRLDAERVSPGLRDSR